MLKAGAIQKLQVYRNTVKKKGFELRSEFLAAKTFNTDKKKNELENILRIREEQPGLKKVYHYTKVDGWDRLALETSDDKLIPVLLMPSRNRSGEYVIVCDPQGKKNISAALLDEVSKKGTGIVLMDLAGTGEASSTASRSYDKLTNLHTLARAELWLGRTILGEWIKEMNLVAQYLTAEYKATKITIDGSKESGLAGLFLAACKENIQAVILRDAPISYVFDNREGVDFFSMAVHLPGFLQWGDVSLAAALTGKNITFVNPVTMSGNKIRSENLQAYTAEFDKIRAACGKPGKTVFINGY